MGDLGSRLKWDFNDPEDSSDGAGEVGGGWRSEQGGDGRELRQIRFHESHFVGTKCYLIRHLLGDVLYKFLKLINILSSR